MNKCFADKIDECSALTEKVCANCNFYKTENQHRKDRKTAFSRLSRLKLTYLFKE